ncbi:MAG: HAD-IB family phosphatase [Candidatus Hodarchaeales archaeon]
MTPKPMKRIVLIDFDGTIILQDSALYILERYGTQNWRKYDDQLLKGEISLEECLSNQFSSINITKDEMLSILDKEISFRPNFNNFSLYCNQFQIPLIIVSAGLDFIIEHFLSKLKLEYQIPVISGITEYNSKGFSFSFPELKHESSKNFKDDLVHYYQIQGYSVYYIGDGSGDFYAAQRADIVYTVKNSELENMCNENDINFRPFLDFKSIIQSLLPL